MSKQNQEEILKKTKQIVKEIKRLKKEGFELKKEVLNALDEAKAEAIREDLQS